MYGGRRGGGCVNKGEKGKKKGKDRARSGEEKNKEGEEDKEKIR